MHDNPQIFPTLPPREPDEHTVWMLEANRGTEWQTCWEFVLTHELTETERAAFWNGARLAMAETHSATKVPPPPEMPALLPDPVVSYATVRGTREEHQRCRLPDFEVADWGSPGDIRRCPHGRVQHGFEVLGTFPCYWRDLSPIFNPILYRRAVRALESA